MFGLVLARPSPNKLICLLAVFCIRYEVETKYNAVGRAALRSWSRKVCHEIRYFASLDFSLSMDDPFLITNRISLKWLRKSLHCQALFPCEELFPHCGRGQVEAEVKYSTK